MNGCLVVNELHKNLLCYSQELGSNGSSNAQAFQAITCDPSWTPLVVLLSRRPRQLQVKAASRVPVALWPSVAETEAGQSGPACACLAGGSLPASFAGWSSTMGERRGGKPSSPAQRGTRRLAANPLSLKHHKGPEWG